MTDEARFKFIDLVARAIRVMASRNPVSYADAIQEYSQDISLMSSMPVSFIQLNKENFNRTEQNAAVIVQMGVR